MRIRCGYEIKNLIQVAFCNRCKKRTAHKFSYTRKTKHRPKRYVYYGCICGVSLIRIGCLDENKNIIFDKDRVKYLKESF
jgi:hypothetical protein